MKLIVEFTLLRNQIPFSDSTPSIMPSAGKAVVELRPGGKGELKNAATYTIVRLDNIGTFGPRSEWMQALATVTIDEMLVIQYRPIAFFIGGPDQFGCTLVDTPGRVWYKYDPKGSTNREFDMWGLHVRCQSVDK